MKLIQLNSSLRLTTFMVIFSGTLLTGCSDRVREAENKMAAIRNEPALPIEPPPQPERVEDFIYNASNIRSPFLPSSLLNQQNQLDRNDGVKPDLTRKKEPLEQFELSQLVYRGKLVSPDGEIFGLIQLPSGLVESVRVGDYMGVNDGRIVEITPTQVNLIEIVPESRGGFAEKPTSLVSPL